MASQVTIVVSGGADVAAKLSRISLRLANLQEPMDDIGDYLTTFFSGEVFASRGRVIGEPWAPLKSSYAAYKARRFPGAIPLIRQGVMNRSFTSKAGRLSVVIRNESDHFIYHQEGTRRLPARTMMKVDSARERRILDVINQHIAEAVA